MELWDAYNEKGEKLEGITLVRDEPRPAGVFHIVCEIIVRHADGDYLLMQRDARKHFGGMWEASAGGSVIQGEDALTGAKRELFEGGRDLGVQVGQPGHACKHERYRAGDPPHSALYRRAQARGRQVTQGGKIWRSSS